MKEKSPASSVKAASVARAWKSERQQILIVDDREENLFALKNVLQEIDADVVTAISGNDALRLSLNHDFALAILDVQMPGMDGYELAEFLRSDEHTARVPIVFLSAIHRDQAHVFRGFAAGAVDYITKPFEPRILLGKVKVFLELDQQKRELRRQVELEKAKSRLENILLSMAEAVVVVSNERLVETVNAAALSLLGYERDELLGRSLVTFMPDAGSLLDPPSDGSDSAEEDTAFTARSPSGLVENLRSTWLAREGRAIPVLVSSSALRDAGGVTIGAVLVARDLTEITQVLEEQQQVLKTALDGFWVYDEQGRLLEVNDATSQMSGYSREELLAMSISDLEAVESADVIASRIARVAAQGHERFESRHKCKDGRIVDVEVSLTHNPDVGRFYAFVRDITDRKQAEATLYELNESLARSNNDLKQFAYIASHDLQAPLRVVAGYTELLAESYKGKLDDQADEYIACAVDGAKRMRELITDLLALSGVGMRGKPLEPTDCGEVVADVLRTLEEAADVAGAEIVVGDLPTVMADRIQLEQVFQNLIGNAIKFHVDAPPRVEITARRVGADWEICVSDNGVGVDPQFHERIFDAFHRLHGRGEFAGSGIGLAIVKKIVERHGGRIRVDSVLGQGARFIFTVSAVDNAGSQSASR